MTKFHKLAVGGVALGIIFIAVGCGGGGASSSSGTSNPAKRTYLGTQAPGDVWSWSLNNGAFTATNQTSTYTYAGTYTTLVTKFLKLTITSTTDPGVTVGSSAYALEFPGTALMIKPAGADTKPPIVACSLGTNPAGPTVTFNYVKIPSLTFQPTDEAYGYRTFTVTGNQYAGVGQSFDITGNQTTATTSTFTGENGQMTDLNGPGGAHVTGVMTPSGVCALDYGPGNGGTIGVEQPATNVDLADLASKSFNGYLIENGKTQCIVATPNGDGTLHGTGYANPGGVETGALDSGNGPTIHFTSQPQPGIVKITLTYVGGGSDQMVCAVNKVDGKYMLFAFAVGQDNKGYNPILVQQ